MPSHEPPKARPQPHPPRPKSSSVTQMGLGMPALPPPLARPLPPPATHSPLPLDSTVTPLPLALKATVTPLPAGEALSIWNSEQTVAINAPKPQPLPLPKPRPPAPHKAKAPSVEEFELIDAEEVPASSSGAPTLDALTIEAGRPKPPPAKRPQDDFLTNLGPGNAGILGAPTIDVSHLDEPDADAANIDFVEDSVQIQQPMRAARSGTVPLYDMSAVLPAGTDGVKLGGSHGAPLRIESGSPAVSVPASEGKARVRKFVVAPHAAVDMRSPQGAESAPKKRRVGAAVWGFGLVALAAGVAAVVGSRGHAPAQPVVVVEPPRVAEPPRTPVAEAPVAVAATAPTEAQSAAPEAPHTSPTTLALAQVNPTQASTGSASTKSSEHAKPAATVAAEPPPAAEPAPEPKAEPAKPETAKPAVVVAHNAPPPAAEGTEFDRAAARSALSGAAAQASSCRKDGDPSGTATLTITFAPSGRVTSAQIQGPPFAGTPTGGCIASTMRRATVPAFSGEHVTVTKQIVVQ